MPIQQQKGWGSKYLWYLGSKAETGQHTGFTEPEDKDDKSNEAEIEVTATETQQTTINCSNACDAVCKGDVRKSLYQSLH